MLEVHGNQRPGSYGGINIEDYRLADMLNKPFHPAHKMLERVGLAHTIDKGAKDYTNYLGARRREPTS